MTTLPLISIALVALGSLIAGWALTSMAWRRRLAEVARDADRRLTLSGEEARLARATIADQAGSIDALRKRLAERRGQTDHVFRELTIARDELKRTRAELAEQARRAASMDARAEGAQREVERQKRRVKALEERIGDLAWLRERNTRLEAHVKALQASRQAEPLDDARLSELQEAHYATVARKDAEITRLRAAVRASLPAVRVRVEAGDDLTRIAGVDRRMARDLGLMGVSTWRAIAAWSEDDMRQAATRLAIPVAAIQQGGWVEQAVALVMERGAEDSGRVASGHGRARAITTVDDMKSVTTASDGAVLAPVAG